MKIVINRCFGGFGISLAAAQWMASKGHLIAKQEIAEWEKKQSWIDEFRETSKWPKDCPADQHSILAIEAKYNGAQFYGFGYVKGNSEGYQRDDPILVECVEKLGKKASGQHAQLDVVTIPDGIEYEIDNYDGVESIHESHRTWR